MVRDFHLHVLIALTPWSWQCGWYDDRDQGGRTWVLDCGPVTFALTERYQPGERAREKHFDRLAREQAKIIVREIERSLGA